MESGNAASLLAQLDSPPHTLPHPSPSSFPQTRLAAETPGRGCGAEAMGTMLEKAVWRRWGDPVTEVVCFEPFRRGALHICDWDPAERED